MLQSCISILIDLFTWLSSSTSERQRIVQELKHFYQPRAIDLEDDEGDDIQHLDCWELKDPHMAKSWTTLLAPNAAHLVFATSFRGEVEDPQHLDFETKITDIDDESPNVVKVFCSSTRPEPYHFTIVIDTIKIPYSIVDCYESLLGSNFDLISKSVREGIERKEYQTAKGDPLKSKPLAKKLRSIIGALERDAAVQRTKITARRQADVSGVTNTISQVQSQASAQVRSGGNTPRQSDPRRSSSAPASPVKKRVAAKKPDGAARKKSKFVS